MMARLRPQSQHCRGTAAVWLIAILILSVVIFQTNMQANAQGTPLLTDDDKAFLHSKLGISADDDRLCTLSKAEAARLHRFIRAGDVADVRAYLDVVVLDQVSDAAHHVPRANLCEQR